MTLPTLICSHAENELLEQQQPRSSTSLSGELRCSYY